MIVIQSFPNRLDHARQAIVADAIKARIAVKAQRGAADFRNAVDFPPIPNIRNKALDEAAGQVDGRPIGLVVAQGVRCRRRRRRGGNPFHCRDATWFDRRRHTITGRFSSRVVVVPDGGLLSLLLMLCHGRLLLGHPDGGRRRRWLFLRRRRRSLGSLFLFAQPGKKLHALLFNSCCDERTSNQPTGGCKYVTVGV
jgi:hypothetical protein